MTLKVVVLELLVTLEIGISLIIPLLGSLKVKFWSNNKSSEYLFSLLNLILIS